jgi:hypothetical protein
MPTAGRLASAHAAVRVVEAMMVSVIGIVMVRTATVWFLAELAVVVRLARDHRSAGGSRTRCRGGALVATRVSVGRAIFASGHSCHIGISCGH